MEAGSPYNTTCDNEGWSSQTGECEEKSQLEEDIKETTSSVSRDKSSGVPNQGPAISFETDSTLECTSKRNSDEKERSKNRLLNMAKIGRGKKSWL
ncbi:hypothetical protein FQN60_000996 [Etheostoma spectabile]|uniref:Uncharacterized protein n=1 Tax=Etheostoma spectabile TaxID=54343 RepID=A0A5J5D2Q2_9PERO|nr:hypothetical protein FQN60_000996 [Etheostoma spectabile]